MNAWDFLILYRGLQPRLVRPIVRVALGHPLESPLPGFTEGRVKRLLVAVRRLLEVLQD